MASRIALRGVTLGPREPAGASDILHSLSDFTRIRLC